MVVSDYLLVAGLIFALNLLPAFGPPTAAVLVALTLSVDVANVPLILCGALAAASGRFVLASATRRLQPRLSSERRRHLAAAEDVLTDHRGKVALGLGLFALSPVPSGQLFVAAGLMEVPLLPLTAAFFAGRLVSYSIYVTGASAIKDSVGDVAVDAITSPIGIAAQVLMLIGLAMLLRVDWADVLRRRRSHQRR
jgi:membrane protein YqaA with SNARE-associated domain